MSWLRDTIAGRTIVVLVIGLGSILGLSQYLYQAGVAREVRASNSAALAERLLLIADTILAVEPAKRDEAAHRLSGGPLELHWGLEPLAVAGGRFDDLADELKARLVLNSPGLAGLGLVIGTSQSDEEPKASDKSHGYGHTTLVSLPLKDGSWLNATLARVQMTRATSPSFLLSAALGALGVVLVSVLMSRWLTRPLDRLASGARQLFATPERHALPETGTREVRTLASAINDLQRRIHRLVADRTGMLAAVSHDLRTPLTRLRLRIRAVSDVDTRRSIEADLDEMEEMINATLAFLREDASTEKVERVDLSAILETIAADAMDAGHAVSLDIPSSLVIAGRHLALKRALTNLVQNAIKYGGIAKVSARADAAQIRVSIEDDGPGIPTEKLEAVFQPFYRLETSRARSTGGHGLGLTVTRTILRAHGGDVVLKNGDAGGIVARVTLPTEGNGWAVARAMPLEMASCRSCAMDIVKS